MKGLPMAAVSFKNDQVYAGFALCHGVIRDTDEGLCLEYQTKDAIAGVLKTGVQEARIPWTNVASILLRRKWFGLSNELIIQLASLKETQDIPGVDQGRLVLPIARRDVPFAQSLVNSVNGYLRKL
jgi:hypothetical protein